MNHIDGYFVPDESYRAFADSMHTTYPKEPNGHGIPLRRRGIPGGFKEVYEGVFGNQPFAVLVFRFYGLEDSGQRKELDMDIPQENSLARRLRDKEFDNLVSVSGCRYRCAPTPYAKGTMELSDAMGTRFYAIAEQLVNDLSLEKAFLGGRLGNKTESGNVTDLDSERAAEIGLCLARAISSVHEIGTHRDLKPANFAYGEYGGEGVVTLLDWGTLAEPVEGGKGTSIFYSAGFTAPERNYELAKSWLYPHEWPGDENVGRLTHSKKLDVYSLGATIAYLRLYHALEGVTSMGGLDVRYRQGFHKALAWGEWSEVKNTKVPSPFVLEDALRALGSTPDDKDLKLSEILLACTQPHPSERMALQELISSLERMLDSEKPELLDGASAKQLLPGKDGTRDWGDGQKDGMQTEELKTPPYEQSDSLDRGTVSSQIPLEVKDRLEGTYELWLIKCSGEAVDVVNSIRQSVGAPLYLSFSSGSEDSLPYLAAKGVVLGSAMSEMRRLHKLHATVIGISTDSYCQIGDKKKPYYSVVAYDPDTDQNISWWLTPELDKQEGIGPEYVIQMSPTKYVYAQIPDRSRAEYIRQELWHELLIILITKESLPNGDTRPGTSEAERVHEDMSSISDNMRITVKTTDGSIVGASIILCFSLEYTGDDTYILYQLDSDEVDENGMETIHASKLVDMGNSYSLDSVPDAVWPAIQEVMREIIRAEGNPSESPEFRYGLKDKFGIQLL